MFKSKLTISTLTLSASLLLSGTIVSHAKEKVVIDLQPKTGWAATMIEGASPVDGYCALARQYNKGLVLTLGQSARDEYSLAIDFQDEKLNTEKPYKVMLQPGPGEIRAYEMMAASSRAMVVRLGYDESFLQSLEKSNQLKVEMDGKNYQFSADDMTQARAQLKTCMAGLRGESPTKVAANFSAEKIDNSEFKAESVQVDPIKIEPKEIEEAEVTKPLSIPAPERVASKKIKDKAEIKKKEIARIADVTPESIITPKAIVTPDPIIIPAPKSKSEPTPTPVVEKIKKPIQMARVESKAVALTPKMPAMKAPKVETPKVKAPETKAIIVPEPIVEKAKAVIPSKIDVPEKPVIVEADIPKMEDKKLSRKTRISAVPEEKKAALRPSAIAAQGKKYGSKAIDVKKAVTLAPPTMPIVASPDPVKVAEIKEAPKPVLKKVEPKKEEIKIVENDTLNEEKFPKPFSKPVEKKAIKKTKKKKEIIAPAVEKPRAPEVKVEKAIEKTSEPPKPIVEKIVPDPKTEKELAKAQEKLKVLEKENHQLYQEAKKLRGDVDSAVAKTSNQALKRMVSYEKKLEAANADNLALSKEVEELRRVQEDARMNAASGDPAAQQSVGRYNEAKREIKRLGLLLEQQRLSHRQEKVELEDMLFDPAVTEQAQRRKLADLENKLAAAEERLRAESRKVSHVDNSAQKNKQNIALEQSKIQAEAKRQAALNLAQVERKQREAQAAKIQAQKISEAEARLAQAKRKEQEVLRAEKALQEKTQAQLAEVNRKKAQVAAAERRVQAQTARNAKIAAHSPKPAPKHSSKPVAPTAPVAKVQAVAPRAPMALNPSAKNIRSTAPAPSFGKSHIQGLLKQSGLSSVSAVTQKIAGRYSWHAAGMSGKAEVSSSAQSLSQFAQNYIAKEKKNCRGDFASLPSTVPNGTKGYDIACIGANGGKSSSVVFVQKGRDLIAISHETSADNMDAAIDARDKVASNL